MEVLQAMSQLFEDPESVKKVLGATSEQEIYDLFIQASDDN